MGKRPLPPPVQPQQEQQQQQQYGSNDEQLMKTKMKNKLKHGNPMSAVADGNTRGDGKPSSSAASNKGQATTGRGGGPTTTSKAVKQAQAVSSAAPVKKGPVPTAEIDDLFASLSQKKKAKTEQAAQERRAAATREEEERRRKRKERKEEEGEVQTGVRFDPKRDDPDVRPWKRDATGMAIYCPDDMRVGKGGNTALCPFDCNCCF